MTSPNWKEQYESERDRLLEALSRVTDDGIVESIQHIGSTSVPGLQGSSCIDIGLAVWPFPLEAGPRSRLEALDYEIVDGFTESPQQRFRHKSGSFQLLILEPGVGDWYDFVLVGDYLRHNDTARDEVSTKKLNASLDKSVLFAEFLPEAHQWWIEHYGFSPLEAISSEWRDAQFEWYASGGWALDLFMGSVQRVHHDVDIVVPRVSQLDLQKYLMEHNWKLITPFEKRLERWPPHMRLELPRHQIHAHREDTFIDILLTDMDGVWRYRREPLILRSKEKMSLRSEKDIPYLAPELVLLFKSKNTGNHERAKDQLDFEKTLPHLDPEQRAWLRWALVATIPEHSWVKQL
jgi:GrpB-like predicted nucleotidyltransferase (UPF0157 family)